VEAGVCDERIEMEMTQDDIDSIVELHNELRHRVAYGQEDRGSPGPQPAAFNMPDLVYYITANSVIYFDTNIFAYTYRCGMKSWPMPLGNGLKIVNFNMIQIYEVLLCFCWCNLYN
jgi:hypothetical protein